MEKSNTRYSWEEMQGVHNSSDHITNIQDMVGKKRSTVELKSTYAKKHMCTDTAKIKQILGWLAICDATDAAFSAADVHIMGPVLETIRRTILISRSISERMKNYTVYVVSFTIRNVLGFTLLALIWKFDFPPFMVLVIVMLNDIFILGVEKDCVKSSPPPFIWNQSEIFTTGIVLVVYLAMSTVMSYSSGQHMKQIYFHDYLE
ncbi:PREDICTED: plasma membrane ATPase 2-like [Nicotiana attenuata]|uniref:plasma membrane ATPase 2-like n=1 Tax=Nicotiana attenuata TaxID=49451 RepID=UPI0009056E7E|nr:PREDICTED: plasma membrane ATPase 2-like [Nicotiana attenuata]